jgi:chromosome segregation ATPase
MSRPGITYQEVANAAIQLQGQNDNPTVDRVREILETGSKSTIARYLKEWKSKSGQATGSDIPGELISIVNGLWERLKTEADQKILNSQQETERDVKEIRHVLTQEQKRSTELMGNVRDLEEQLHQKSKLSNSLQQSFEEEKRTNAKLSERNDRLSQQLADQKIEAERLHQLLSHIQTNLEHYQISIQKLREEQILSIEKQKTEYEREVNSLKKEISDILRQKNQLELQLDPIKRELTLINEHKNKLTEENSRSQKQLYEKTINESILTQKCDQLDKSCIDYQKKFEEKSEIIIDLEKRLAIFSNQVASLQKLLNESQDKIKILRDEKLFLAQEKSHLEGQLKQLGTQL